MLLKLREMNLKHTLTNWMFIKKLIRILNKNTFGHSIVSLFKKCKFLNIYQTCEFKIVCQSLVTTRYSHFNFPLPQSTSAAGYRRTEFQVAKMWNSLLINLRAVSDLIEFGRELRLHLLGWGVGVFSRWTGGLACVGQCISNQAMGVIGLIITYLGVLFISPWIYLFWFLL